jgi:hypothetical protein
MRRPAVSLALGGYAAMLRRIMLAGLLLTCSFGRSSAGVVNPDISVIGQPFARWTSDLEDPARKRVTLDPGEVEAVFDAYLNPYARGTFVLAIGDEGLELEEGYFQLLRGLPGGVALKGGKYRVGFGKLNPVHPHALPFAERFRVLAAYLPGEEAFNETGVSLSEQIALSGDAALTASADWLQGSSFRVPREPSGATNDPLDLLGEEGDRGSEPRPAVLGRLAGFIPVSDRSGIEIGFSGAEGTSNVAAGTRTRILGGDVKAKLWNTENSYLLLQGEVLKLKREEAGWDSAGAVYTETQVEPAGGYVFADYNFNTRYNVGAGYERWQDGTPERTWNNAFKVFAGFSLMEETTAFRLDWDHMSPGTPEGSLEDPDAIDTVTLRVIFSMGPHKAHQF